MRDTEQPFRRGDGVAGVQTVDLSDHCLLLSPSQEKFCTVLASWVQGWSPGVVYNEAKPENVLQTSVRVDGRFSVDKKNRFGLCCLHSLR